MHVNLDRVRADMLSWERLCSKLVFGGCELLIIDTEGHEAAVLRSMIEHCKKNACCGISVWPKVIQFETMSHCDKIEGGRHRAEDHRGRGAARVPVVAL